MLNKKKFIASVFALLCLGGCTASHSVPDTGYTFTDSLGRTVTVASHEKTAVLIGSFAEVWMLAGGEVTATVDDAWEDFKLPLSETAVNLGGTKNPSLELLLSTEPDFVIASSNTAKDLSWTDIFDSSGITTAYFDVSTFEDYLNMLDICTDITGRKDLYEIYGENIRSDIDNVRERAKLRVAENGAQTVLFLRASAASIRAKNSHDSVLGEMLADLGCINIADNDEGLLENLSLESIISADPDKIFFVQVGDDEAAMRTNVENMFAENPAWYELTAVREGHVYFMDKHLYNLKPNARWGEAYEQLEAILEK